MRYSVYYDGEPVKVYELDEPVISIGRLPENTIPISNMGVSRRHVKIEEDTDKSYVLTDLNSLNGTFVNGKKVKKVTLAHGDKICIGKYTIFYECDQGPEVEKLVTKAQEPEMVVKTPQKVSKAGSTVVQPAIEENEASAQENAVQPNAVLIETTKHVVYKLDRDYFTLGSDDEDDIFVTGFMVNKAQAVIERHEDGFYLSVQKLMTKIKVNGKGIKSHRLEHKDRIEIGSSTFRFMENG